MARVKAFIVSTQVIYYGFRASSGVEKSLDQEN